MSCSKRVQVGFLGRGALALTYVVSVVSGLFGTEKEFSAATMPLMKFCAFMAEFERSLIQERVTGLRTAKAKGEEGGRAAQG